MPPESSHAGAGRRLVIMAPVLYARSFLRRDFDLLAERHEVREVPCLAWGDWIRSFGALRGADLMFCWFGSVRFLPLVLLARLLGKPVVIISGGYDVANEPAIAYGNMRGGATAALGRLLFRLATVVVPYSRAGQEETTRNARVPLSRQRLIYLGFPPMGSDAPLPKRPMVLTVGRMDESTIHRKGLLTIAQMSHLLPDVEIVMAGGGTPEAMDAVRRAAGPNVQFPGIVSEGTLHQLLSEAAVYLQPSAHEAFGCAVAEAMLHGSVPVVSDRGSLPEVVGDTGFIVPPNDPQQLAANVRLALGSPPGGERPRDRILRLFPLDARRQQLHELVEELCAFR
jgi:glycosyltransferase involved in cell wall biosynthesis